MTLCFFEEYYTANKNSLLSNFFDVSMVTKKKNPQAWSTLESSPCDFDPKRLSTMLEAYHCILFFFFAACDFAVSSKGNPCYSLN